MTTAIYAAPFVDESPAARFTLAISAQPLVKALTELSRISGQPLVYDPTQIPAITTNALQGNMTSGEALAILLRATGMQAQWYQQGWIIKPAPVPAAIPVAVADEAPTPQEVVVTGYYSKNLQTALAQKRARHQLSDAVVAEDIEHIPAQNIAEALQHSPGVTVVRDRGEALFVSIRGLPSSFNKVTFNGQNLASNENVRNSGQYGRRFHFDTFPAELAAAVEVVKTASADQDEGAIGGTVNLHSFAPFDLQESQASVAAALDESELAGSYKPRLSGLVNWINADDSLGIAIAASYAERSLRQDRALNFGWQTVADGEGNSLITPLSLRPTLELEEREREGMTATLQWRPADNLALDVHSLWLAQTIHYDEFSYGAGYGLDVLHNGSALVRENALYAGESELGSLQVSRESAGIVDNNYALDSTLEYTGDSWTVSTSLVRSQAHSYNNEPIKRIRLHSDNNIRFAFNYPRVNGEAIADILLDEPWLQSVDAIFGRRLEWRLINSRDTESALAINARYRAGNDWLESIELGVKTSEHERHYQRKDAVITQGIATVYFPPSAYENFPVSNFLINADGELPRRWLIPREDYFWGMVDEAALYQQPPGDADLLNSYGIRERVVATFIKASLHGQLAGFAWQGDIGLRGLHRVQTSSGYQLADNQTSQAIFHPTAFHQGDGQLLPSANVIVNFSPDLLWRTALGETIARPDFQDSAPRITLNSSGDLTAVGGNPALQPVRARQLDTAVEWYFADAGLLSAGVFYKQLRDFFQNQVTSLQLNGKSYALSSVGNGASAYARGVELAYQQKLPAPLNCLGFESNYTYTDSRAHYRSPAGDFYDALADVAKNSINLGAYIETQQFNIRLHYSWRDRVLNQVGTANTSALNAAAFGSLDMHLGYSPNAQWSVNLDAINLANSAQQEFVADNEFASYTLYGRRFLVGIKWNWDAKN